MLLVQVLVSCTINSCAEDKKFMSLSREDISLLVVFSI